MDWIELIEAYFAAKQHAFSPNTRRAYRFDLVACAQVLPTLPVHEVNVSHLRLFLDATTDLAPTTLARRKAALRSCFNGAYQQDLLDADPTARLEAIPIGERHPRPLTEKQVEAILAAIPRHDIRNRLLVTLLYETGMRVGEALGLQACPPWKRSYRIRKPSGRSSLWTGMGQGSEPWRSVPAQRCGTAMDAILCLSGGS
jgi:integrase/recombinase XerC